jgi:hypothetical protein
MRTTHHATLSGDAKASSQLGGNDNNEQMVPCSTTLAHDGRTTKHGIAAHRPQKGSLVVNEARSSDASGKRPTQHPAPLRIRTISGQCHVISRGVPQPSVPHRLRRSPHCGQTAPLALLHSAGGSPQSASSHPRTRLARQNPLPLAPAWALKPPRSTPRPEQRCACSGRFAVVRGNYQDRDGCAQVDP